MATFNKFQQFVEDLCKQVHDLSADQLVVALSNVAPDPTDAVIGDITEVSYADCSSRAVTTTSCEQTGGTVKLVVEDLELTSSGTVGAFRYVVLYNDDSAADSLIGWYDYGSSITLNDTETFTVDFSQDDGVLTIV